jgi:hypothetical protein
VKPSGSKGSKIKLIALIGTAIILFGGVLAALLIMLPRESNPQAVSVEFDQNDVLNTVAYIKSLPLFSQFETPNGNPVAQNAAGKSLITNLSTFHGKEVNWDFSVIEITESSLRCCFAAPGRATRDPALLYFVSELRVQSGLSDNDPESTSLSIDEFSSFARGLNRFQKIEVSGVVETIELYVDKEAYGESHSAVFNGVDIGKRRAMFDINYILLESCYATETYDNELWAQQDPDGAIIIVRIRPTSLNAGTSSIQISPTNSESAVASAASADEAERQPSLLFGGKWQGTMAFDTDPKDAFAYAANAVTVKNPDTLIINTSAQTLFFGEDHYGNGNYYITGTGQDKGRRWWEFVRHKKPEELPEKIKETTRWYFVLSTDGDTLEILMEKVDYELSNDFIGRRYKRIID